MAQGAEGSRPDKALAILSMRGHASSAPHVGYPYAWAVNYQDSERTPPWPLRVGIEQGLLVCMGDDGHAPMLSLRRDAPPLGPPLL